MTSTSTPFTKNKPLIIWLFSTCFLIWLMIMLGGATRLTHAGLSIVEWKPIVGILPPLNQTQWLAAFELYQKFPEYKLINQGMTLSEFQFIYFMEYFHRLLGRLIGLWFCGPLIFFWYQNRLSPVLKKVSLIALLLGIMQGFMGWYMVKSGLVKDPTVSHYRLTIHLFLALMLYGLLFWKGLTLCHTPFQKTSQTFPTKWLIVSCCCAILLTILYGGLVAGLKAGLIYNTFPLMEGQFIPHEWCFYRPLWLNFFENAALVQWMHRWLAMTTVILIFITCGIIWHHNPLNYIRKLTTAFAAATFIQATLGVLTLLYHVPITLGVVHQGMAVIVLSLGLYLYILVRK